MKIEKLKQYCKFLRKFIDKRNYHEAFYDGFDKRWYPKNNKVQILRNKFAYLSNGKLVQHAFNDKDFGFNTNCRIQDKFILICFDFDTDKKSQHRQLQLNNAILKVEKLLKIKMYVEDSTKSGDKHGYIIIDKGQSGSRFVNMVLQMLEQVLDKECKKVGLKQFEVKGMPHEYTWKNDKIADVKFSSPAKLPRDWESIDKLSTSKPVDINQLHSFVSGYSLDTEEQTSLNETSCGFHYYGFSETMTAIQADVLNNCFETKKLNKRYIYSTHLATFIYLCWYFKKSKITHPSMELFKFHWLELKSKGLIDISWNKEIATWCKRFLNENQFIDWKDNRYCKSVYSEDGELLVNGVCCSWQITQELYSHVSKLTRGGNSVTMFSLSRTGRTMMSIYDADLRFERQKLAA